MFNHQKNEPFGLIKCPCCVTVECNSVNSNSKFLWGGSAYFNSKV